MSTFDENTVIVVAIVHDGVRYEKKAAITGCALAVLGADNIRQEIDYQVARCVREIRWDIEAATRV